MSEFAETGHSSEAWKASVRRQTWLDGMMLFTWLVVGGWWWWLGNLAKHAADLKAAYRRVYKEMQAA